MAIATREEIKTLLQITGTDQDALIDALIPIMTDFIHRYCNNDFLDRNVEVETTDITFTSTSTITTADNDFSDELFKVGQDIRVSGSALNDGRYTIAGVTTTTLTVSETTIVTEDEEKEVQITRIKYPVDLKLGISVLIKESIEYGNRTAGVKSDRLGDYSVSYASAGQFSKDALGALSAFSGKRRLRVW
jgi:hypothetical protein